MYERHKEGRLGEFYVAYELTQRGFEVTFPTGAPRYDLIAEKDGRRYFIQVKSGVRDDETIKVGLRSGMRNQRAYIRHEIDVFAIFERESETVYYVPYSEVEGCVSLQLRFVEPHRKNCRTKLADNYLTFPTKQGAS